MDDTISSEFNKTFQNLTDKVNASKDRFYCNKDFLREQKKKVIEAHGNALNNTKIFNFTDEYSPLLLALREKYQKKANSFNSLNKNFNENSEKFENDKKSYVAQAQKLIDAFEAATLRLNYIGKYKLLELKSDLASEFEKFKSESFPVFSANETRSIMDSFAQFLSYCTPDLFNVDCTKGNIKEEEAHVKEAFLGFLDKIVTKEVREPVFLDEEGLIILVKEAKKSLEYTRDIVQKKEYVGLFVDLTKEFESDAEDMGKYLADLKPFELTDIVQPAGNNGTNAVENIETEFSLLKFKDHFLNLLDSTAYMCWVVKHNPFENFA